MHLYELTYVLRSDLDEDAVKAAEERINGRLTEARGELVKTEGWGRRRLAYPIERIKEGFYFTSILRMPGEQVRAFENQLKLVPEILRFLLIRQEERNINLTGSLLPTSHRPAVATPPAERTEAVEGQAEPTTEAAKEIIPSATEEPAEAEPEAGAEAPEAATDEATGSEVVVPGEAESIPEAGSEAGAEVEEPAPSTDESSDPTEAEAVRAEAQG